MVQNDSKQATISLPPPPPAGVGGGGGGGRGGGGGGKLLQLQRYQLIAALGKMFEGKKMGLHKNENHFAKYM